jgi:hypothetical protein
VAVCAGLPALSAGLSHHTCHATCVRCTPSNSGQRLPPLSYRGCWHRVSRGLFQGYRHHRPPKKWFTTRRPSSHTRRCSFRLAPIDENSLLLPPVGVWAVLSPSLAVCPLRPATRHWLGAPLPHQLPDGPQAPPGVTPFRAPFVLRPYAVLATLSGRYSPLRGRLPTCYSPVCHSGSDYSKPSFDLHALGTPPAFILSQDQTLRLISSFPTQN